MMTSNYTGLISLGATALFGYSGALFGAVVVLPAVLGLLAKEQKEAPDAALVPEHAGKRW